MALEFSTIGVKLNYVIETTAGTRPTSGVTNIPDIKNIPGFDLTPNQLAVTNLSLPSVLRGHPSSLLPTLRGQAESLRGLRWKFPTKIPSGSQVFRPCKVLRTSVWMPCLKHSCTSSPTRLWVSLRNTLNHCC